MDWPLSLHYLYLLCFLVFPIPRWCNCLTLLAFSILTLLILHVPCISFPKDGTVFLLHNWPETNFYLTRPGTWRVMWVCYKSHSIKKFLTSCLIILSSRVESAKSAESILNFITMIQIMEAIFDFELILHLNLKTMSLALYSLCSAIFKLLG